MTTDTPRIAIATCAGYDDLKVDDELLREAFAARGAEARSVVWDGGDPGWEDVDLCLVRSTWDYHDKYEEFIAWTRRVERAAVLHNPAGLIAWNSEKTYLRELGEAGEALAAVLSRQDAMVQPFLPSLETEGELSLIFIAGTFSHAVRKRPAPGDFRVQSIWGGTVAPATPDRDHLAIAERALAHLKEPPLYARADLVTNPAGRPLLIELELIEPNLYLSTHPSAVETLANAALKHLS